MIVSLHLPKTAGASFLMALQTAFGRELLRDYGDMHKLQAYFAGATPGDLIDPVPLEQLRGVACVHGHFLPAKYRNLAAAADNRFITWMRDPVQRLCSHYFFWRRSYDPAVAGPLFRRVIEENWSLDRFCLSAELQNIYTKYLYGFDSTRFDFIGVAEYYADDLKYLSDEVLGIPLERHATNQNSKHRGDYVVDKGLTAEIASFHAADYALYHAALAARAKRY